jgi:hypothetical protein
VIAAVLTALMILLFLGSWRSTLIIAISIPLSVLASLAMLSAIGETINLMTLGGLALAVGILVDDATVTIENVERHLSAGETLENGILVGAGEIALPALVSTTCICIVFVPMFFLTGVARYLFAPLAEAVVFAVLASYALSRTLVPTLVMWFERSVHRHGGEPRLPHLPTPNPRPSPSGCGHWPVSNKDLSMPSIISANATGTCSDGSWLIGWLSGRRFWPFAWPHAPGPVFGAGFFSERRCRHFPIARARPYRNPDRGDGRPGRSRRGRHSP